MTKGAPDILLARCTHERAGVDAVPLTDDRRAEILATIDRFADAALRTLGVGYRVLGTTDPPRPDESLEQDLVDIAALGRVERIEPEVVEDEKIDGDEPTHLALERVVETRSTQILVDGVASDQQYAVAAPTSDVAEATREVGLADADRPEDEDVVVVIEEAQRGELGQ